MTKEELLARLEDRKIITENGCWLFTGPNGDKKKEIYIGDRNFLVTRVSASIFKNLNLAVTTKLVCHYNFCPEPDCWNPGHYYIGDTASNTRDAVEKGTFIHPNPKKEFCKYGHLLSGSNLYYWYDSKADITRTWCKKCRNRRATESHRRNK